MVRFSATKHRGNDSKILDMVEIGWIEQMLHEHPKEMKYFIEVKVLTAYKNYTESQTKKEVGKN